MNRPRAALRLTFDSVADLYDAARPSYPAQLFDDLVGLAGLRPGSRLLEIGCGTGKATRPLLERGYSITCIELGRRLAEQARTNLAGYDVAIEVGPFETRPENDEQFDLVFAATAWHWIDPEIRYARVHALLRPAGHLAFWSTLHALPADADPFFADIQEVYDEIGESHDSAWPPPLPELISDETAAIEASGLFDVVGVRRYGWDALYTAEEYIALLDTFSGHIAMTASQRERLYSAIRDRIGRRADPRVRRHWQAILHVAQVARG